MATNMDQVMSVAAAAGFTTSPTASTAAQIGALQTWQSLAGAGVGAIMQTAVNLGNTYNNVSIQTQIELEYVTTANDVIFKNLNSLQVALSATDSVLSTLTVFQNVQNNITASMPNQYGPRSVFILTRSLRKQNNR